MMEGRGLEGMERIERERKKNTQPYFYVSEPQSWNGVDRFETRMSGHVGLAEILQISRRLAAALCTSVVHSSRRVDREDKHIQVSEGGVGQGWLQSQRGETNKNSKCRVRWFFFFDDFLTYTHTPSSQLRYPLFFCDKSQSTYVRLTPELHDDIVNNKRKL
jgi:hypothetical protein